MSRGDPLFPEASLVSMGRVVKPRGIRGEVLVELLTDFPDHFERLNRVFLKFADGRLEMARLENIWFHKERAVVRLAGSQRYEDAERILGAEIQIPEEELLPLPVGTYYDFQLMGCEVLTESGERLGPVKSVLHVGDSCLLVIDGSREVLIPACHPICRQIDLRARQIIISPPEGLVELNR